MNIWPGLSGLLRLFGLAQSSDDLSDWAKIAIYLFIEAIVILAIIAVIVRNT